MKTIESMTKQELQNEIVLNNDGLYNEFNEKKFLNDEYTHEELLQITTNWIISGSETL